MFGIAKYILVLLITALIFLYGCTGTNTIEDDKKPTKTSDIGWKDITLKDVKTGKSFKISDFKGKPVLVESFAVWCPTCTKQQNKIKELHEEVGDSVISVSLDTDPNEEESKVLEHINSNGFNWLYAVSPSELTRGLIDEFGINVVNAPLAPIILICEDQSSRLLKNGVKTPDTLKSEIGEGC